MPDKLLSRKKIYILSLFFSLVFCRLSYADSASDTQGMNFGAFVLSNPAAGTTLTLDTSGSVSSAGTIGGVSGSKNGIVRYNVQRNNVLFITPSVNITPSTDGTTTLTCSSNCSSQASSCSISIDNITYSSNNSLNNVRSGNYRDINYGAQASIPANCGSGIFQGNITLSIEATTTFLQTSETHTVYMPITLTINPPPIQISNDASHSLNFGTLLSSTGHYVTVDTNDNCTSTVPSMIYNNADCSSEYFDIEQTGSDTRNVNINIVSNPLSNSTGNTLELDNFSITINGVSAALGSNVQITQSNNVLRVGGRLKIESGDAPGAYTGTYTVNISY